MKLARVVVGSAIVVLAVVVNAPGASAGCHSFTIAVSPSTVNEGDAVTVTVSRDGNLAPSRVHVRTIAGTAQAPQDYDALVKRPVPFTSETSKSFTLQTRNDPAEEDVETFSLRLVDPDGCPPNHNYQLGPDAVVTIRANDAPVATPTPATGTASPAATEAATPAATLEPAATPLEAGETGISTTLLVGILAGVVVVLLIVLAFVLGRRRSGGTPSA